MRKSKTYYLIPCQCGEMIEVLGSQAGSKTSCETCQIVIEVDSFSQLVKRKRIERLKHTGPPAFQFTVKYLVRVTIAVAVLAAFLTSAAGNEIGLGMLLALGPTGWAIACNIGLIIAGGLTLALILKGIPEAREMLWDWIDPLDGHRR